MQLELTSHHREVEVMRDQAQKLDFRDLQPSWVPLVECSRLDSACQVHDF